MQLLCLFDEIRIIFEPLTIAIFQLCLLLKMRLSVDLEGRYTGYKTWPCTIYHQPIVIAVTDHFLSVIVYLAYKKLNSFTQIKLLFFFSLYDSFK